MSVFKGKVEIRTAEGAPPSGVHAVVRRVDDERHNHLTWEGTLSGTLGQLPNHGEVEVTFPDGTTGTAQVSEVTNETATLRTVWAVGLGPEPPWQQGF